MASMAGNSAKYPNRLRASIKQAGLTVKEVAEESGIPLRTLFEYCKGDMPIPRKKLADIALVLGYSPQYLVPATPMMSPYLLQSSKEDINDWIPTGALNNLDKLRRDLLIQIRNLTTVVGLSLLGSPEDLLNPDAWERLLHTLEKPTCIDEATLGHLEALTDTYWSLYHSAAIPVVDLLSGISGHLTTATRLLKTAQPVGVQFRLCSIVSNTAQILGEMYKDLYKLEDAKTFHRLATRAAEEVDNRPLRATVLARISGLLVVYQGKPYEALPLLREASTLAAGSMTGQTKAWIAMIEAQALSRIEGKQEECLSALKKVEEVFSEENSCQEEVPNRDDRKWTDFNQPLLTYFKGQCLVHLRQPEEARSLLLVTLGEFSQPVSILTDLALSYVQSQEIEEACHSATQALVHAAQLKSPRALQRLGCFQKTLQPWRNLACVRRFGNALKILEREQL